MTDELQLVDGELYQQPNKPKDVMNILLKILYDFLHQRVLADEQAFRNKRIAIRQKMNNGYSKAGH